MIEMYGAQLLTVHDKRVTKETLRTNNMAYRTDDSISTETVAQALRELAISRGDQDRLSEFLTDYFASDDNEFSSGK